MARDLVLSTLARPFSLFRFGAVTLSAFRHLLGSIPYSILIIVCLTLGLTPFFPEPHIWEKLKMLAAGELSRPIDIFDLLLHGTPWLLLGLKLALGRKPAA